MEFDTLKVAMSIALVLTMPNFNKPFLLETNALGVRIGVVLMQGDKLIAFLSKAISAKYQSMSACEKELFVVVFIVKKLSLYLMGHHFIINIDHQDLKHSLEQQISTPM